jgi:hypothetical protein
MEKGLSPLARENPTNNYFSKIRGMMKAGPLSYFWSEPLK